MLGLNVVTFFFETGTCSEGLHEAVSGVSLRGLAKGLWATLQRSGGRELRTLDCPMRALSTEGLSGVPRSPGGPLVEGANGAAEGWR